MTKYLARLQDPGVKKWKTKSIPTLKLAKDIEAKLKTDLVEDKFLFIQIP